MFYETDIPSTRTVASLEDYLAAIRQRKLWVAVFTIAGLALALLYTSSRTEQHQAVARVVVNPTPVGSVDARLVAPNLGREAEVIASDAIAAEAAAELPSEVGPGAVRNFVDTTFQPDSDVIRITVTHPDPERAAAIANAVATSYVEARVGAQRDYYADLESSLSAEAASLQTTIQDLNTEIAALDLRRQQALLTEATPERQEELDAITTERSVLLGERSLSAQQRRTVQGELSDVVRAQASEAPAAEVLKTAGVPGSPQGLSDTMFWLGGVLVGLAFGIIAAFTRHRLDRSVTSEPDVELGLRAPVMGTVPRFGLPRRRGQRALVMLATGRSAALHAEQEAYRRLRSSLQYVMRRDGVQSIVVTSTHPSEGKSTTAVNLAIAMAGAGSRVALVSGDLRRPTLESQLGLDNRNGLSLFLAGARDRPRLETLRDAGGVLFLPAGPQPPNPGELLSSDRLALALGELESLTDLVIIDTPPVGAAADALALAATADGVLVVIDGRRTDMNDLAELRTELERSGTNVLGAILNRESRRFALVGRRRRYSYGSTTASAEFDAATRESTNGTQPPPSTTPRRRRTRQPTSV